MLRETDYEMNNAACRVRRLLPLNNARPDTISPDTNLSNISQLLHKLTHLRALELHIEQASPCKEFPLFCHAGMADISHAAFIKSNWTS